MPPVEVPAKARETPSVQRRQSVPAVPPSRSGECGSRKTDVSTAPSETRPTAEGPTDTTSPTRLPEGALFRVPFLGLVSSRIRVNSRPTHDSDVTHRFVANPRRHRPELDSRRLVPFGETDTDRVEPDDGIECRRFDIVVDDDRRLVVLGPKPRSGGHVLDGFLVLRAVVGVRMPRHRASDASLSQCIVHQSQRLRTADNGVDSATVSTPRCEGRPLRERGGRRLATTNLNR